jgi:prepilin-type N-terminal cleavage/methylation domain-containing protein
MMSLRHLFKSRLFSPRSCRGVTLIELLIAMSIGSLVVVGSSQILTQLFVLVPKANYSAMAMRQVEFAGHRIERDTTMAQTITPTPDLFTLSTSTPLVISHVDWNSDTTTTTYSVNSSHALLRQEIVTNKSGVIISSNQTSIADGITSITAQYTEPDQYNDRKILTLTITAQVGNSSASRIFKISPRTF